MTDLIAATPDVTITITAEPQERKYSETAAKAFTHDTGFTVANILSSKPKSPYPPATSETTSSSTAWGGLLAHH